MTDQTPGTQTTTARPRGGALLFEPTAHVSSARDIAELIFKHLSFGLGIFSLVMILSIAFTYLQPPVYQSTAKVLVERGKRPTQRSDILEYQLEAFEAITSEIEIIKSRTVAEDVVDRLALAKRPVRDTFMRRASDAVQNLLDSLGLLHRLDRRESLVRSVQNGLTIEPAPQSSVLLITYSAESAAEAADIATAVMDSYLVQHRNVFRSDTASFFEERVKEVATELEQLRERLGRETDRAATQSLLLEVGVLEKAYTFYREKLNTARADMAGDESLVNVRIIDRPVVAARPARSRMFTLLIALVAALFLSVALVFLREYFDHKIYSPRDIEGFLDVPVLGSVVFVQDQGDTLRRRRQPANTRELAPGQQSFSATR
jgi:uncharacterized protein involved in exopolysaccharide biosynthesis